MIMHCLPFTIPIPVTTLAEGIESSPNYLYPANYDNSRKGEPWSIIALILSLAYFLSLFFAMSLYF